MSVSSEFKKRLSLYVYGRQSLDDLHVWYANHVAELTSDALSRPFAIAFDSQLIEFSADKNEYSLKNNLQFLLSRPIRLAELVTITYNIQAPPETRNLDPAIDEKSAERFLQLIA